MTVDLFGNGSDRDTGVDADPAHGAPHDNKLHDRMSVSPLNTLAEELYEARKAEQKTRAELTALHDDMANLLRAGAVAAIFLDDGLDIRDFTPRAAARFDLSAADRGRPVAQIACRLDFDGLNAMLREAVATGRSAEREVYQIDGGWLRLRVQPYRASGRSDPAGIVLLFEDIQALRVARAGIEKSNNDLQNFAYAVSHDLQEPARMIISFAELLERRYGDAQGPQAEFLEQIRSGGRRLRDMLDSLLRYSRVATQGSPMAHFDLGKALESARDSLSPRIAEEHARIEWGAMPTVWGDQAQLSWLLRELIENALKFRSDAAPHIRIGATRLEDGCWRIRVADNGVGLAGGQAENAFKMFKRLRGDGAGVGAGLAVAARIVERHGGTIHAEPGAEGGALLCFTLHGHATDDQ